MQVHVDIRRGDAQHLGHVGRTHLLVRRQHQHFALPRRQRRHPRCNQFPQLGRRRVLKRIEGAGIGQGFRQVRCAAPLAGGEVVADYGRVGLTLRAHPVSCLRADLARRRIVTCAEAGAARAGQRVEVAGLVLVRQRPGSAKGVIFMTIEDETGVANIIVWPKVFEHYRSIVMGARLVKVRGRLQKAEGVIHVVAEHLVDATDTLGLLREDLKDFGGLANADEVRRPVNEQRHDGKSTGLLARLIRDVPDLAGDVRQTLPKGRNFH